MGSPSAKCKILVVDDDRLIRGLARDALEPEGFDVTECSNGADALDAFDRVSPDLVILDLHMPGLDGFEVCRRLRKTCQVGRRCLNG